LSALREGYLRLLAGERGMRFLKLQTAQGLVDEMTLPALSRPVEARADARVALAALAFCLLLARSAWPMVVRLKAGFGKGWRSRWAGRIP
jgi:mxaL protein